jgi:hypothetical protein
MQHPELTRAVEEYAQLMLPLSERDLEIPWKWKDHDEEGIRFSFFVTLEDLRSLAVRLFSLRTPPEPVQRILGQYHAQTLDLRAAILGLSPADAERVPAEGEWPVQRVYSHMLGAEINFRAVTVYALEAHRAGTWTPDRMSEADETRIAGLTEEQYKALTRGSFEGMLSYHRELHARILEEFSLITEDELDLPCTFWEETRFPIRHRLHRFEAHLCQHTVQIDKTLILLGLAPSESKQILRKVYAALAEAESAMIGVDTLPIVCDETAQMIRARTEEIRGLLSR